MWIWAVFHAFLCCFIVSYGEHTVWRWSQYSSVFCIMPHFRLIILHIPIWGQSWSLNCILHHYSRFILKGIFEQTQVVIFILMEVRQWRKDLPQTGDSWPFKCTLWLRNVNDYSVINVIILNVLVMFHLILNVGFFFGRKAAVHNSVRHCRFPYYSQKCNLYIYILLCQCVCIYLC